MMTIINLSSRASFEKLMLRAEIINQKIRPPDQLNFITVVMNVDTQDVRIDFLFRITVHFYCSHKSCFDLSDKI